MRRPVWLLALLVAGALVMILLGFPLRTYMSQRAALSHANATLAALSVQNKSLQNQAAQLQSPAEIQYLARADYGLVQPGQEAYALLPAATPTTTTTTSPPRTTHAAPSPAPDPGSSGGLWSRFLNQLEFWR